MRRDVLSRHAGNLKDVLGLEKPYPLHTDELVEWVLDKQAQIQPESPRQASTPNRVGEREGQFLTRPKAIPLLRRDQLEKLGRDALLRRARDINDILASAGAKTSMPQHQADVLEWVFEKQQLLGQLAQDPTIQPSQITLDNFVPRSKEQLQGLT